MNAPPHKGTIVVCHGAWFGGWAWQRLRPPAEAAGYRLLTPTYTGLGERAHLAHPDIGLETYIQDILNVITYEDLTDIILLGHSFGGMVATGVADRARDRVRQLIYLDAFVPRDGDSILDINVPLQGIVREAVKSGYSGPLPPIPFPPDTSPADIAWCTPRLVNMPIKALDTKLKLQNGELTLPRSYIYCTRIRPGDVFGPFANRAKSEPGWRYFEIDASHSPNVTTPEALMAVLEEIVGN
jgi:pimeloyl-ACP methyl ester carboxylesterase